MSIKPLSREAVHQICSSQVIISLSATLKELIENSLDAEATAIEVYLNNYGSELMEVVDNGLGILPHNFPTICLKHFTSKLSEFSDLQQIETFGFRGEALSSMCAVSSVSVVTRHSSEEVGSCLEYDCAGELVRSSPCAAQRGTRVSIKNIFMNLPVRRIELMKNIKREFNKLLLTLHGYCLVRYDVRFKCFLITKKATSLLFSTTESCGMRDAIVSIFGSKTLKYLIPITKCDYDDVTSNSPAPISSEFFGQIELSGYISSPEQGAGRNSCDRQFFFLNSRPCDYPLLSRLLNELFHEFDRSHFPFATLSMSTQANQLDVNLTPDKRSILVHSEQLVLHIIRCSIHKLFSSYQTSFSTSSSLLPLSKLSLQLSKPSDRQTQIANPPSLSVYKHVSPQSTQSIQTAKSLPDLSSWIPLQPEYSVYVTDSNSNSNNSKRTRRVTNISIDVGSIRNALLRDTPTRAPPLSNGTFSARINPEQNDRAEAELRKELSKDSFNSMEIVGQFNLGFIVTRLGIHLFIIDQHATDEKHRFESLQATERIRSQPLMAPLPLELSVATELVVMDNLETYEMNGFEVIVDEHCSPTRRLKLRTLPISKGWVFGEEEVEEMALLLQERPGVLCRPSKVRSMFASRACRSAVMIGTALTHSEMKRIVRNMARMEHPWQCPHGRPTMRYLTSLS